MNKRLIWNFEINSDDAFEIAEESDIVPDELRWESRFFWPSDAIITLQGLPEECLQLCNYKFKAKHDFYYLLPDSDYNLKVRRDKLMYKPLLIKSKGPLAYGKKIDLETYPSNLALPGHETPKCVELLERVQKQGQKIIVIKESVTYQFKTHHKLQLELAQLQVSNIIYFSACVESRVKASVETVSKLLFGDKKPRDYVSFLKSIKE